MRIVIDLQSCQSGSRNGGIGRYSMNLAQAMARNAGAHELHVVLSNLMLDGIADIYKSLDGLIPKNNIHFFKAPGPVAEAFPENTFRARAAELIRENYIFSLKPDFVHVTSLFEGLGDDVTTSVGRLCGGVTTAVTLYDLIPLVESEKYLTNSTSYAHYHRKIEDLRNAGLLLSISEFSKIEAIQELGISPDQITNISSAVDEKFKPWCVPDELANELKSKYGITRKFLMYTGSFDQRKNHESLIKAFAALPESTRKDLQLVIVGNGWDGIYAHLKWVGKEVGLLPDDLIFAGKVPDDDLLPLYNLCHLFVFPSLREGFGLPVLEAMSCGIPVIGSNSTSIPEVLGTDEALFDPTDINSISQKINAAVTDENLRNFLIEHGLQHAKNFSWDASAKRVFAAFEACHAARNQENLHPVRAEPTEHLIKALKKIDGLQSAPHGDIADISNSVEEVELLQQNKTRQEETQKIGVISTWNSKCGIAMYSKYLFENERDRYVIFAPKINNKLAVDDSNVVRCWEIGSDNFDELFAAIQLQGISNILIQFNYGFYNFETLNKFIHKLVIAGREVSITFHSTSDPVGYLNKELKALKNALSICENIFVHSRNDIANLAKIGVTSNVQLFPQGVFEPSSESLSLRIEDDTFVVASYGFFLPHKGFLELIDAVGELRKQGQNIHLLMLNAMYDAPISQELISIAHQKIKQLAIENSVSIVSDFLSEDLTIRLMRNANLVIFPYQETGESSSAAVRMGLASGIPVAVTPLSIFDDVQDVVFKLPGTKPDDLVLGIKDLKLKLSKPSDLTQQVLSRAKKWVDTRRYTALGRRLREIIRHELRYPGSHPHLLSQVGRRNGQSLHTTGLAGCLLHGPYISLDPGDYNVIVSGTIHKSGATPALIDAATTNGTKVIAKDSLFPNLGNLQLAKLHVSLSMPCTDFEVRIWVDESIDLEVHSIEVKFIASNDDIINAAIVDNAIEVEVGHINDTIVSSAISEKVVAISTSPSVNYSEALPIPPRQNLIVATEKSQKAKHKKRR